MPSEREAATMNELREQVADALYLTYHGDPIPVNQRHTPFYYAQADAAISVMQSRTPTAESDGLRDKLFVALATISAMTGNVDHSKGGGSNTAKMYGEMLMDIRKCADAALSTTEEEAE